MGGNENKTSQTESLLYPLAHPVRLTSSSMKQSLTFTARPGQPSYRLLPGICLRIWKSLKHAIWPITAHGHGTAVTKEVRWASNLLGCDTVLHTGENERLERLLQLVIARVWSRESGFMV